MSSSSAPLKKTFHLRLEGLPADANLTIYNGWDEVVGSATGQSIVDLSFPPGLYTLRGELAGLIRETSIRLDHDLTRTHSQITPLVPEQFTAAPIEGTALSHEYYRYPSSEWSKKDTRPPLDASKPADASVFVFIRPRFSGDHPPGKDLAEELFLLDADGTVVSSFAPSEIRSDIQHGWLALSARAPSGFYSLEYRGALSRAMAIYLFPGWQTQIFILHHRRPIIEGMRMFLARVGFGFNPLREESTAAIDLALDFLQNGVSRVPQGMMQELLQQKFENPMLGLVAGYVLVRQPSPDLNLLNIVTMNLEGLLGSSVPDVNAIRTLKSQLMKEPPPAFPFRYPPMFRAGLEGIIRASVDHPELLPPDSVIERIATGLFADSAWSSWKTSSVPSIELPSAGLVEATAKVDLDQIPGMTAPSSAPKLDWVQSAVLDGVSARVRRLQSSGTAQSHPQEPGSRAAEPSAPQGGWDLRQVALRLNLPERAVQTALEGLSSNPTAAESYLEALGVSGIKLNTKTQAASTDLSTLFSFDIGKTES